MPKSISQRELRNDSGEVLGAVQAGEEFVVTRNGTPVAELRPLRAPYFCGRPSDPSFHPQSRRFRRADRFGVHSHCLATQSPNRLDHCRLADPSLLS